MANSSLRDSLLSGSRKESVFSIELKDGRTLYACGLTGSDQSKLIEMMKKSENDMLQTVLWPLFALTDDEGVRLFKDSELDLLLTKMSRDLIVEISSKIVKQLAKNAEEVAKETKNSEIPEGDNIGASYGGSV